MKRVHKTMIGIAAFATLGLGMERAALAEPPGMMGPEAHPYEQGMMGRGGPAGKGQVDFAAVATKRLDKLKTELKITPAQESAWQAFAGKAQKQVEAMQGMRDKMRGPDAKAAATPTANLSAPERMEKGIEFMKQRLANMEAMAASLKDLYAVLTPEQKAIADKHFSHHQEQREQRRERMMRHAR